MLAELIDSDSATYVRDFCWDNRMDRKFREMCVSNQQSMWAEYIEETIQQIQTLDWNLDN